MNQQLLEELLLLQLLRSVDDDLLWIVAHRVDQLLHLLGAAARGPQRDHRTVLAAQHRPDVEDGAHRLAHNADAAAATQRVHAVQRKDDTGFGALLLHPLGQLMQAGDGFGEIQRTPAQQQHCPCCGEGIEHQHLLPSIIAVDLLRRREGIAVGAAEAGGDDDAQRLVPLAGDLRKGRDEALGRDLVGGEIARLQQRLKLPVAVGVALQIGLVIDRVAHRQDGQAHFASFRFRDVDGAVGNNANHSATSPIRRKR